MRWGDMRKSDNIEDRTGAGGGGGGGMPFGGGMRLGGGATILLIIVGLIFGINPFEFLGMSGGDAPVAVQQQPAPQSPGQPAAKDTQKELVARVVGDTEDVWTALFQAMGSRYEPPKLVFFNRSVDSACGRTSAAAGPFYCPGDRKVYLDTSFFAELKNRFGAPGDFAQAYVVAHEVGHHVQNLLGTMREFEQSAGRMDERRRNAMTVRLELQADCYAGVWGFFAARRNLIDASDVEEGLRAAAAVGDDSITKGRIAPDAFTHGSAEQRSKWFRTGLQSGDPRSCNTFAAKDR